MTQRHVGGDAALEAERHADDLGLHVVEAGGLGVEGEQIATAQRIEPPLEVLPARDAFVVALHERACAGASCGELVGGAAGGAAGLRSRGDAARLRSLAADGRRRPAVVSAVELLQQRAQLVARVQLPQPLEVRRLRLQLLVRSGSSRSVWMRGQLARQLQCLEPGAQILAHLALNLRHVRDQLVERAVLLEQLGGGLRPDLVDARECCRSCRRPARGNR